MGIRKNTLRVVRVAEGQVIEMIQNQCPAVDPNGRRCLLPADHATPHSADVWTNAPAGPQLGQTHVATASSGGRGGKAAIVVVVIVVVALASLTLIGSLVNKVTMPGRSAQQMALPTLVAQQWSAVDHATCWQAANGIWTTWDSDEGSLDKFDFGVDGRLLDLQLTDRLITLMQEASKANPTYFASYYAVVIARLKDLEVPISQPLTDSSFIEPASALHGYMLSLMVGGDVPSLYGPCDEIQNWIDTNLKQ